MNEEIFINTHEMVTVFFYNFLEFLKNFVNGFRVLKGQFKKKY